MTRLLAIALLLVTACKDKGPPAGGGGSAKGGDTGAAAQEKPRPKIDGPSVTPTVTNSVTFVTPKSPTWWGEFNFSCYRAVMSLTGTRTPGEAFENLSPTVPAAMAAGEIDLGRDLAAMGIFECEGSPCLYVAAALKKPEKLGEVLKVLLPNSPPTEVANNHYKLDTPGSKGTRTIHVRAVPIQWTKLAGKDAWSQEANRATHVVFIGGVDGKNNDVDPLTVLGDEQTNLTNVKEAESVLGDARNRCMLGLVSSRDFQPGFKLERGRFAIAAPPATKTDALMGLMSSQRTLDVEVELVLSPPPNKADVEGWVVAGKGYMSAIGQNVRAGMAGQGELMDVYFDMAALIGVKAFRDEIKDKSLKLSWRTDRIPESDLATIETRLQGLLGTP